MTGAVSHISSRAIEVIIGVDTHKDQHVAVAIDGRGVRLDEKHVPVATCGYEEATPSSRSIDLTGRSVTARGRVIPLMQRWQRAQCLQG